MQMTSSIHRCAFLGGALLLFACTDGGMVSPPADDSKPSFTEVNSCQTITFNEFGHAAI